MNDTVPGSVPLQSEAVVLSYAQPSPPPPSAHRPGGGSHRTDRWPPEVTAIAGVVVSTTAGLALGTGKSAAGFTMVLPILCFTGWYIAARFRRRTATPRLPMYAMATASLWCLMWTSALAIAAQREIGWALRHDTGVQLAAVMIGFGVLVFAAADVAAYVAKRRRRDRSRTAAALPHPRPRP